MNRRYLLYGAGAVIGLLGLRYYLIASAPDLTPPASLADVAASNPLPDCPATPHCVRTTRTYPLESAQVFAHARAALQTTGADSIDANAGTHRLDAVYRVFFFKDDVAVAVTPYGDGAALHIRSTSRVGHGDWSVNARRVARILEALAANLKAAPGS